MRTTATEPYPNIAGVISRTGDQMAGSESEPGITQLIAGGTSGALRARTSEANGKRAVGVPRSAGAHLMKT